ncbi:MAG: ABC1 kinase family protein [Betaproteobacteria bacterium]
MLLDSLERLRALPRLVEVTHTLLHYGMSDLVHSVGLHRLLDGAGGVLGWNPPAEIAELPLHERLRLALEELGPAFVKMGQVLASRVDMLDPDWIASLDKLHDRATPVPFELLETQFLRDLGRPIEDVFSFFDKQPAAAGSIAQVHRAALLDGTQVAVKIRRPGVTAKVDADLLLLETIAAWWEEEQPKSRRYQPVEVVRQVRKSLARELDFAAEGRAQERFVESFRTDPTVAIPRVHAQFTRTTLVVMDWVDGIPGTRIEDVEPAGLDRGLLAARGADAMLKMVLVDGLFHADPHPGNTFFMPGNRIALIDFGMIGWLSERRRDELVDLLAGVAARDAEAMRDVLIHWTEGGRRVSGDRFAEDLGRLLHLYEHATLREMNIGTLLNDVAGVLREHHLLLPPDLALLFKALITLEGLGSRLVPHFRLIEHMTPYVNRLVAERMSPARVIERASGAFRESTRAMRTVPRLIESMARRFGDDGVAMRFEVPEVEVFGRKLERSVDRLVIGLVTAALIIGSSILMAQSVERQSAVAWWMGAIGVVISFVNSLWLIASVRKSHRSD